MDLIRSDILTGSMVFPTTENLVDFDIAECGRSSRAEGFKKSSAVDYYCLVSPE
jgi:hypothetical protein